MKYRVTNIACWLAALATLACARGLVGEPREPDRTAAAKQSDSKPEKSNYQTETLRGHIVWLAEAMQKRFGVASVPEAKERTLAIETDDGTIVPIAEDVRGRAFRADPRLREGELELLVRRFRGAPAVQVIRMFALENGKKFELDYWCDVCSITMFELKTCECCQGPIELRKRIVKD